MGKRATLLIWLWEMACKAIDFLTLDLMTGKSWVKKSVAASPRASRQEYGEEAPTLPPPVVVHLAVSDRLERRAMATPEEIEGLKRAIRKMQEAWGDQVMAEELIREIDREWEASNG